MRQVRGMKEFAAVAVAVVVVAASAACGEAPEPTSTETQPVGDYLACMVTDTGGIDDRSFNTSAWLGLTNAAKANARFAEPKNVASDTEADYVPNLTGFVQQDCDFILAVGGLMTTQTTEVATANPNHQFAIVDSKIDLPNVYSLQFNTAEAAFLAGYLAAGYSKTGTVGTYGGMKLASVTVFMDGFVDGVAHYNEVKGKNVKVLGWDKATQTGSFTEDFGSQAKGKAISDAQVAQGADVILPVAGGAGLGTAAAAKEANGAYAVIWVDIDGCESAAPYCSVFLTTVVKNIPDLVRDAALLALTSPSTISGGTIGTLANNGVSIAPYHEFDSKIDPGLKAEVEQLKQDIISGKVKVTSPSSPA